MADAVIQAKVNTGPGPTISNAENGVVFGLADAVDAGADRVTQPTSAGTNYSFYKTFHLSVETTGDTTISDRKIRISSSPPTGLHLFFKDGGTTYTQATSANKPTDNTTTNGAVPSTYTEVTTTFQTWHAGGVSSGTAGRNGNYVVVVFGLAGNYGGGVGAAVSIGTMQLQYLES